jgi:WD40 repeat protein
LKTPVERLKARDGGVDMLALCTLFSDLVILNEKTGVVLHTVTNAGWECNFSTCGRWVMCFNLEHSCLNIVDTISGQITRSTSGSRTVIKGSLRRGCFGDDKQSIICAGQRFVERLDLWSDTVLWHINMDAWYVATLITSGDGRLIALEGSTDQLHIIDASDGHTKSRIPKKKYFRGVTFTNNGLQLVILYKKHLDMFCTHTWARIRHLPVDERFSEAFLVSTRSFVMLNKSNQIAGIDLTTGKQLPINDRSCHRCGNLCTCPSQSVVNAICTTADRTGIVTGHRDGHFKLWDAQTGVMLLDKDVGCTVTSVQCSVDTACDEVLLAFAMGQHERLGENSVVGVLNTNEVDLVLELVTGIKRL